MPAELRRLLNSYRFLERALTDYGAVIAAPEVERLRREQDSIFLRLLKHVSHEPRVTQAQITFLVATLAEQVEDTALAAALRDACTNALERVVAQAEATRPKRLRADPAAPVAIEAHLSNSPELCLAEPTKRLLDSLTDRTAIYTRDYRYLFTNAANAQFHDLPVADFADRPIWTQLGKKCFEEVTKPNLDMVFAGASTSHVASLRLPDRSFVYSITYDPMFDSAGNVATALVVARDITHLGVQGQIEWPAPDA